MTERRRLNIALLMAAVLGGAGAGSCGESGGGSDPQDAAPTDSGAGDGGSAEGGLSSMFCVQVKDEDKVPAPGGMAPAYKCDNTPSTQHPGSGNSCRNDSDCAIIGTGMVREIVRQCALGCRTPEPHCEMMAKCNSDCVLQQTRLVIREPGLSAACGACYTNVALCSLAFCLSECAADADAPACVTCQFQSGCRVPFERCSGLDRLP